MRPHRRQPTRLPHPWGSPGKNTVVGCHFLLQCMKVKSESEVSQLCPTLSSSMDCSLAGSSIHGIFQARVLEWVATAFSIGVRVYLWAFYFVPLIYISVFVPVPYCLDDCTFVQFSSFTQSCPTLCDPLNHSTPGLPVHHQLLEFTQIHVH